MLLLGILSVSASGDGGHWCKSLYATPLLVLKGVITGSYNIAFVCLLGDILRILPWVNWGICWYLSKHRASKSKYGMEAFADGNDDFFSNNGGIDSILVTKSVVLWISPIFFCLLRWLFTFYHGKSPWTRYLVNMFDFFQPPKKQIQVLGSSLHLLGKHPPWN